MPINEIGATGSTEESTMNMNATRLDDRLNSLIVTAAVFGVLLTSALSFQSRMAVEPQIAQAPAVTLPAVYVIAAR